MESCRWIELTSTSDWDPNADQFQEEEERVIHGFADTDHPMNDRTIGALETIVSPASFPTYLSKKAAYIVQVGALSASKQSHPHSLRDRISSIFGVGLETANRTLEATTQLALRNAIHPNQRRYRTEVAQLRYPRLGGQHGRFHTDTFFAAQPSLSRCTMGQMFTNDVNFSKFYPMKRKSEASDALVSFMQDIGIPCELHSDDAKELTEGKMGELLRKFWIKGTESEPYSPWQVRAELCICEVKKAVWHTLMKTNAPKRLWDYCTIYHCELRNLMVHPHYKAQGRTPHEIVTGRTPDISEYLDYHWFQTVWYLDQDAQFPEERRKLGKWIGVAHRVGQALCYYILPASARPIVRSTVQPLTQDELSSPTVKACIQDLDLSIRDKVSTADDDFVDPPVELQDEDDSLDVHFDPMEPEAERPEADDFTPEALDNLINAEVILPKGDILIPARVIGRKRDESGNPIGTANTNPILDTCLYDVQFLDGRVETYAANIIAENIYSQLDDEGNRFLLLEEIMDHRRGKNAVHIDDKYIIHNGRKTPRCTTQGWEFLIKWRDGSTS